MTRAIRHVEGLALALPEPGGADEAIGSTDEYPFTAPPPPASPAAAPQPNQPDVAPLDPSLVLPVVSSPQPVSAPSLLPFPVPPGTSVGAAPDDVPAYEPLSVLEERRQKHYQPVALAFRPGDRVNYRSIEEIRVALRYGYLELDFMNMGQNAHMTVREQDEGRLYTYAIRFVGNHTAMRPAEYKSIAALCASVDLHAFRWYPNGSY